MPISFYRYQKANIYVADYLDHIESSDLCDNMNVALQCLESADAPLNFIADWRHADNYPINFDMISLISKLIQHPNMREIVVIGINPALQFWGNIFASMIGLHYQTAASFEEALKLIRSQTAQVSVSSRIP